LSLIRGIKVSLNTQKTQEKQRNKEVPAKYEYNFLFKLDKRMDITKELLSKYDAITHDMGGSESISYLKDSLVQRFLFLEYYLQQTEKNLVSGKEVDIGKWVQSLNSIQGLIAKLGLERKPKDIYDYLNAN
jgi:hypothetical protein